MVTVYLGHIVDSQWGEPLCVDHYGPHHICPFFILSHHHFLKVSASDPTAWLLYSFLPPQPQCQPDLLVSLSWDPLGLGEGTGKTAITDNWLQ